MPISKINNIIKKWQDVLNFSDWEINYDFVEFKRDDGYPQRGDIKVDEKNKNATILLKENQKDIEKTILHELIHLLLWKLDYYVEKKIPNDQKDKYFEHLESTATKLTEIIYKIH